MSNDPQSANNAPQDESSDDVLLNVHEQLMHHKESPASGFSMMPIVILFVAIILSFVGGIYLISHSKGFDSLVYDTHTEYKAGGAGPVAYDPIAQGEKIFGQYCTACHQATGAGIPGVFPTLHGTKWVNGQPERMVAIVMNGLGGEIEVSGTTYNSVMTAHGFLKDKDIAAVVSFVRSNAEWGNTGGIVEESVVAGLRAAEGSRASSWTSGDLLEIWPHQ